MFLKNKSGGERQILYGLTYKWNLINKTNKKAHYNQDTEIKNKLIVTRAEGAGGNRRKKGKDPQGRCIMDPWKKPKGGRIEGGVEVVVGKGNGDNCT